MELGLTGKTVLITGGSQGIGLASAMAFAAEGAKLRLVSRSVSNLESAAEEIRKAGSPDVQVFAADLSNSANVDAVAKAYSNIDILVNNAGAVPAGSIIETDEETWRQA